MAYDCPTPRKAKWSTGDAAREALKSIQKTGYSAVRPKRVYLCRCGWWHLASKPKRRGER